MKPERRKEIEKLYHAALQVEVSGRAAFLDEACAGDEELGREVASLLAASGAQAGSLLPTSAAIGRRIGHYQVQSLLGAGGMGEVYLAEDTQLGRKLALKLLPAQLTTDVDRLRRFEREARAASALNHPNIITIFEIGQDGSTHYIATEFIDGETLRQQMSNAPEQRMKPSEAVNAAAQIAAALAAAHEAGIIHRDIKPENVMVRRDGLVKVLDFGLAKLTEPAPDVVYSQASTIARNSTEAGVVLGTPRYMSPEQASGEKVDARTDIFSLDVVLYEMLTGQPAFRGASAMEVIAAILRDSPRPLAECAREAPSELERIVGKALQKNREERYQNANDLLADLKELQRDLELATDGKTRHDRTKTEGRTTNRRRVASIAALAGLVIAIIGAWFYLNRPSVLTSKDTILLADFENKTGEGIFDVMLKQGLAIQLQQSPFLNLFPEAQMRHELQLMRRPPNESVTAEIAREICARQNLKALIAGSIAPLGSHYVITLEALNGQSGETLAREQVEAENKEHVLQALSQAATRLRGRLGESLSLIQRFDRPLQEGTTARPEAFKAYSQAIELAVSGRSIEAIPFYRHAVEIDPEFASAYCQLAIMYWVTEQPELAAEYAQKSYQLKDRAGEIEKFRITHMYHRVVTGDLNKVIEVLRLQRGTYPREYTGANDLGVAYAQLGQYNQAVAEYRESIRLNPSFAGPYARLTETFLRLNRFEDARDVIAQALHQGIDHKKSHFYLYQLAFIEGDTAEMQRQVEVMSGSPERYAELDCQTGAAACVGQWRKARELSRRAIDLAAHVEMKEVAARYETEQALRGAVLGECLQARADALKGLSLERGRATLPRGALALAMCGEANQVRPLIDDLTRRYPEDTIINSIWLPTIHAAIELQHGNAARAIEHLQAASRYEAAAEFWPLYLRGQAYLKLGRGAEAATEFQKILSSRGQAPLSVLYPLANSGLARAATLTGDVGKSRKAYQDFLALWKDADANLPILIEAKKEYERLK